MKQAKRPSGIQKMILAHYHLKPENRLIVSANAEELTIIHRYTKNRRTIAVVEVSERNNRQRKK